MNFMRFKWLYFALSALVLVPGIISLILWGLRPAIDFTGGTLIEYQFTTAPTTTDAREALELAGFEVSSIASSGEESLIFRLAPISQGEEETVKATLAEIVQEAPEQLRLGTVGPILGRELLKKAFIAILLAAGFILAYVAWRFRELKFGICAILAMFHDSLILLGSFSLLGHFAGVEVDVLFVTAVLTILSFSVHDTIVVYDRIRESQRRLPQAPFVDLVNKAITETLSRSINNSLTIIFMLVALLLLGGETIRWFVAALLIGTIAGTYSSTFTAAPLLVVWENIKQRRQKV